MFFSTAIFSRIDPFHLFCTFEGTFYILSCHHGVTSFLKSKRVLCDWKWLKEKFEWDCLWLECSCAVRPPSWYMYYSKELEDWSYLLWQQYRFLAATSVIYTVVLLSFHTFEIFFRMPDPLALFLHNIFSDLSLPFLYRPHMNAS